MNMKVHFEFLYIVELFYLFKIIFKWIVIKNTLI